MTKLTKKEAEEKANLYDSEFRFCPLHGGSCKSSCPVFMPAEISLNKFVDSYEVKKGGCTAYSLKGPRR